MFHGDRVHEAVSFLQTFCNHDKEARAALTVVLQALHSAQRGIDITEGKYRYDQKRRNPRPPPRVWEGSPPVPVIGYKSREDCLRKLLQRYAKAKIGMRPSLQGMKNIVDANPRNESHEEPMTKNDAAMALIRQGEAALKGALALCNELRHIPKGMIKHPDMPEENAIILGTALQVLGGIVPMVEQV